MVVVDTERCIRCGLCTKVCHEHCMELFNNTIQINYEYCSTCTQCIAICPVRALSWNYVEPMAFEKVRLPSKYQLDELFKERRTIRHFINKEIDREVLEEIVGYGIYAPTHNFNFRVVIVDNEEILDQLNKLLMNFSTKLYKYLFKPKFLYSLVKTLTPVRASEYIKLKSKLEFSIKKDHAFKSKPVALVFIIGDKRVVLSEESAQYALYNMSLYAQVIGIGSQILVGNQMLYNKIKILTKQLRLLKNERIFGTLGLGYPGIQFRNKVEGKRMNIQWNDE